MWSVALAYCSPCRNHPTDTHVLQVNTYKKARADRSWKIPSGRVVRWLLYRLLLGVDRWATSRGETISDHPFRRDRQTTRPLLATVRCRPQGMVSPSTNIYRRDLDVPHKYPQSHIECSRPRDELGMSLIETQWDDCRSSRCALGTTAYIKGKNIDTNTRPMRVPPSDSSTPNIGNRPHARDVVRRFGNRCPSHTERYSFFRSPKKMLPSHR